MDICSHVQIRTVEHADRPSRRAMWHVHIHNVFINKKSDRHRQTNRQACSDVHKWTENQTNKWTCATTNLQIRTVELADRPTTEPDIAMYICYRE